MSAQASSSNNPPVVYRSVSRHELEDGDDGEGDVHYRVQQVNNWQTFSKAMKYFFGVHALISILFAVAAIVGLSFSFDHCNPIMNGMFVVVAIEKLWTAMRAIVRLATKSLPSSGHYFAFGSCLLKVWIAGTFTLVAFADGRHCNPQIVMFARILSPLLLGYSMIMYSINEFGFETTN